MYGATDLCQSVHKLKREKTRRKRCWCTEASVCVVYFLSTVKTENTYTPARLEALFNSSQSSLVPSKIRSPSFLASDYVLGQSRCFVMQYCLSCPFEPPTDVFSRIHCCLARHRISICLSGPLRCRMCRAECESISRRTETL